MPAWHVLISQYYLIPRIKDVQENSPSDELALHANASWAFGRDKIATQTLFIGNCVQHKSCSKKMEAITHLSLCFLSQPLIAWGGEAKNQQVRYITDGMMIIYLTWRQDVDRMLLLWKCELLCLVTWRRYLVWNSRAKWALFTDVINISFGTLSFVKIGKQQENGAASVINWLRVGEFRHSHGAEAPDLYSVFTVTESKTQGFPCTYKLHGTRHLK